MTITGPDARSAAPGQAVVDAATLEPLRTVRGRVLVAVAARVGSARLIDNLEWSAR